MAAPGWGFGAAGWCIIKRAAGYFLTFDLLLAALPRSRGTSWAGSFCPAQLRAGVERSSAVYGAVVGRPISNCFFPVV
jgi:hypothetical protein